MYTLNTNYFTHIDSEPKAYLLAWFWSRGSAHIQVSPPKSEVLFLIRDQLEYTGKIYQRPSIYELNISNSKFLNNLKEAGCVPNRHISQTFPSFHPSFLKHFLRGIFDSYGTITISKGKYLNLSITYDDLFISILREHLKSHLNLPTKHYYRYSYTNTIQMLITNTQHSINFLYYIYSDSNYYLTRNYIKYINLVKNGV